MTNSNWDQDEGLEPVAEVSLERSSRNADKQELIRRWRSVCLMLVAVSTYNRLVLLRAWIQRTEKALKPAKQGKLPSLESLVLLQMDASRMQLPEKTVGTHACIKPDRSHSAHP